VTVRAIHTPGHRPEHTAFALIDTARGREPWAVLTGDTLFVGDIARPDLAIDKEEGAHEIFRSLHEKLLALPGECEVWPGHLGGSLCGGPGMDMKVSSTIAFERRHNRLLGLRDEDEFVRETTSALGPQPPNFHAIVAINRGPLISEPPAPRALSPRELVARQAEGALIVDVRTDLQFDDAHVRGAVCNPAVRAGFGTKLAWVAERDRDVVLVGRDDADAIHAAHLAASVGVRRIAGYLAGGMQSWREEKRPTESVERIDVSALRGRADAVQILDVRERSEWSDGHIPGSVNVPYHDISGVPDGIDVEHPVAVICSSGQRSAVGASLLIRHGVKHVIHVADGGVGTWQRSGWPIERVQTTTAV
jgi:rhodanese-related sulfurtransferase